MKIDTKEKADLFIDFITAYYTNLLQTDIAKQARGCYTLEKILLTAQNLGAEKISFFVDFSEKSKKNRSEQNFVGYMTVDTIAQIELIGARNEGGEVFDYLINEKQLLGYINTDLEVVKLMCSSSNSAMKTTFFVDGRSIEIYLSRLKQFNDRYMLNFNNDYERIKREETVITEKMQLSQLIGIEKIKIQANPEKHLLNNKI